MTDTLQAVAYHTGDQFVHGLRGPDGRKYIPIAYITDAGVVLRHVPLDEARYMRPVDVPVRKAVRGLKRAGRHLGITKAAADFIG